MPAKRIPHGVQLLTVALYLASAAWLLLWALMVTEVILAPWNTAPLRPPDGTWQRAINDFFETPPWSFLPALALLAGQLSLLRRLLRRQEGRQRDQTLLAVTVGNWLLPPVNLGAISLLNTMKPLWTREAGFTMLEWQFWGSFGWSGLVLGVTVAALALVAWAVRRLAVH